ncbi:MAG: hypothetical protein H7Z14_16135 [Anaerolineae bacterium]|nr:hypothetical protein [Phycisphaerae bacterium]
MRINRLSCIAFVCSACFFALIARAEVLIYNIVPGQSSLTISGTFAGQPFTPQTAGSTTTSYSGTILADVGVATISFPGGSSINAANQAFSQQPGNEGNPGTALANYGILANLAPFGTGIAAIRGLVLDITSGTINLGGTSIPSQQTLAVSSGNIDYSSAVAFGRQDMSGNSASNAGTAGSLISSVGTSTLTIPVNFTITQSTITTNDTILTVTGTLLATRPVPEPGSLAGLTLFALASIRRQRH